MNEELKLDGFEFSQPFVFFWDKFEKANFFLETMIELSQEDVDSRKISYLLKNPIQDGGQYVRNFVFYSSNIV